MSEKLRFRIQNIRNIEQLIVDLETLIATIELLRISIGCHLLCSEVPSLWEGTSER
jgi:hypothetical protein